MKGTRIQKGDIFSVALDETRKMFLQYIMRDTTQLNSEVIRIFKTVYPKDELPDPAIVIADEVMFYAHVILKVGVKSEGWKKEGHHPDCGTKDILFRGTNDYFNPAIKISSNWWVWKVNEPAVEVGLLTGENRNAEIGIVIPPQYIAERMRTGSYGIPYPGFE